ncbi:MAG: PAS domain S-box protein [Gemmataceae bacterium]|nr:PAS domain S-box protein [Gemmataceae bacterium]
MLVAVPLLYQVGFGLIIVWSQREQVEAEWWARHTKEVIAEAHEIQSVVADAHSGIRGYVISSEPSTAEPYRRARRELTGHLNDLQVLVQDNSEQSARVQGMQETVTALLRWQDNIEQLVQKGRQDAAANQVRAGHGNALLAAFRAKIGAFVTEEERLDRERASALQRIRDRMSLLLAWGGLLTLGYTVGLGFAFYWGIARRFAALELTAHRLAAAESPPPPLGGEDEIARVDRALRGMAAQLTQAAAQIHDLYDQAPCGYHSVGPDGTLVAMNRTELQWLGYPAEAVIHHRRFADLVSLPTRQTYLAAFASIKEHGLAADVEFEMVRHDGTTFPVLFNATSVRGPDGGFLRTRATVVDLTQRKHAEAAAQRLNVELERQVAELARVGEALRIGEERFRLLIDSIQDYAILMLDPNGRIATWNAGAERIKGYRAEEIVGRHFSQFYPREAVDRDWPEQELVLARANGRFEEESWRIRKDGTPFWANVVISVVRSADGSLLGYSKVTRDLTERKQAEDEVRRLNADLERRVEERTVKLAEVNRDLARRNDENEMFVYSVSHDLRSPLVNLQGFSRELEKGCRGLANLLKDGAIPQAVRDQGQTLLDTKIAKAIEFIQSAVLRLGTIIDALLRLSRAGRVEYRPEVVDVAGVISRVVAAAQGTVAERGAKVSVTELPPAWGDRAAIEQVFANLLGNALAYLDPARPGLIEAGCLPAANMETGAGFRTYYVRDNGRGIAEAHQKRIFQAFQRAHPGVGSGEGLGLAIVNRAVERHRGRVWVQSCPGEGSTFYVTLPVPSGT